MKNSRNWWKEAVGYQIYPRSFFDANNDGIGDLKGIIAKVDYIKYLGVDFIWIGPVYCSPMDDNGYDVSNFFDIAPEYGTLDDMKLLIKTYHEKGIKVILDLVLNHTSDEHPWFVEACKSVDNPYHDFYIWQKGKEVDGKRLPPNNLSSFFGGSCWNYQPNLDLYYMKIFSNKMPDLNWKNPQLRKQMYKMASWWLSLGIDGFRVDAIAHLGRDWSFKDGHVHPGDKYSYDYSLYSNRPEIHEYLKEMNKKVFSRYNCVTVGEVGGGATPEDAILYSGSHSHELNMTFTFDHCWANGAYGALEKEDKDIKVDLVSLKENFSKWQNGMYKKGWNPLYWLNHDHPRVMSQYGDPRPKYHNVSGKMLCLCLHMMWGTPFIYNGEEIGMTNVKYEYLDEFHDVWLKELHKECQERGISDKQLITHLRRSSRDNARTPMQWNKKQFGGFSKVQPWIKGVGNHRLINVEDQINDPHSLLNFYRQIIQLRKESEYKDIIIYGTYKLVNPNNKNIFMYERKHLGRKLLVVCNFFAKARSPKMKYKNLKLVVSNYEDVNIEKGILRMRPYEALVFEVLKDEE